MALISIESLESRRLFSFENWGDAERLIRLPDAIAAYQNSPTPATGAGQTIAVIDSGIDYNNPLLGGGFGPTHKVIAGYDFADNDADPMDTFGHGTEVAGLLAADPYQSGGQDHQGIAPDANLIALRVDNTVFGQTEQRVPDPRIEQALQWVIDHRTQYNIGVVNISYGTNDYANHVVSSVYGSQIQELTDSGVTIVASAGNNDLGTGALPDGGINTPAADPNVVSVGSVDANGVITASSYRGKILSVLAPGDNVVTTLKGENGDYSNSIGTVSGTSFAAPIVAGTVALMRSIDSTLNEKDSLSILRASGVKVFDGNPSSGNLTRLNYSRLDILAALKLTQARVPATSSIQGQIGKFGNGNALAVDAEGVTHFVYYDSSLQTMEYATLNADGQYSATQPIDTSQQFEGYYVSLAVDPLGKPAVAYFDGTDGDLKFARYDGISWHSQTIDSKNSVGLYPSLTFDRNGLAVISYYRKTTGDLKVAREKLDGTFSTAAVDTRGDVGRSTSIAVDANGRLGIAYEDSTHGYVKYALLGPRDKKWASTVVDNKTTGGASFISTAFSTADNRPWISYYDAGPADLKVAHFAGRTWTAAKVASRGAIGLYTSLIFDDGKPNVVYYDKRLDSVNLTTFSNNKWSFTTLQSDAGRFAYATLDTALNLIRYSYYTASSSQIKLDAEAS